MMWAYILVAAWMVGLLVVMVMLDIRMGKIEKDYVARFDDACFNLKIINASIVDMKTELERLSLRQEELRNSIKLIDSRTYEASLDIVDSVESLSQQVKNVGDLGMKTCLASEKTAEKVGDFLKKCEVKKAVTEPVFNDILKENWQLVGATSRVNDGNYEAKLATIEHADGSETEVYTNDFYLKN